MATTAPAPAPAKTPAPAPIGRTAAFDLIRHFSHEMDRVLNDFVLRGGWPFAPFATREDARWAPDLEMEQNKGKLLVRLDLPGMRKEEVKIEISDAALTIEGERREHEEKKEKDYYRTERSYGRFYRSVALPEGVRPETAQATFADGVLEITMETNAPQPAATRRVEIAEPTKTGAA